LILFCGVFVGLLGVGVATSAVGEEGGTTRARGPDLSRRGRAVHVLNRLAFGPRPGDVDRVAAMGWEAWVDQQLQPGEIQDPEAERRLRSFKSLGLTNRQIIDAYRAVQRDDSAEEQRRVNRLRRVPRQELIQATLIRAIYSERQLFEVMCEFWRNHFNVDVNKDGCQYFATNYEHEVIRKHVFGRFEDMLMASAKHPAMLIYLDNVYSQKPLTPDEIKALARPGADKNQRLRRLARERGLNENYARELLELHTLGVDNVYKQRDVRELARVLTGWTVDRGESGSFRFHFHENVHDPNPKRVLRWRVGGRSRIQGVAEGETVIQGLARHKATARFIAEKLCRYLVADDPPAALVDRVQKVFLKTKGDLRAVTRAIITDPVFFEPAHVGGKFRTPFEFTVAALRAVNADVRKTEPVLQAIKVMRQPVYECEDPTGYYDTREAWLDPGVLALRWQLALDLVERSPRAVRVNPALFGSAPEDESLAVWLVERVVPGGVGAQTYTVLVRMEKRMGGAARPAVAKRLTALLLGSPEFQRQ
jgi:uncharacterized protein (DUF1800 family)